MKGDELVIAYAGTTFEKLLPDWYRGNIPTAVGLGVSGQLKQAAMFYLDAISSYGIAGNPNLKVSFTGHSLGGGLASLMSVFFNRPSTVFDEAPFIESADSPNVVGNLIAQLEGLSYAVPQELLDYETASSWTASLLTPSPTRLERQGLVDNTYIVGEVLWSWLGGAVTKINGAASTAIDLQLPSSLPGIGPVELHSMTLLAAALQSTSFRTAVQSKPELLVRLMTGYSAEAPISTTLDLLTQRSYKGETPFERLAEDLNKFSSSAGTSGFSMPGHSFTALLIDASLAGLYAEAVGRLPSQAFVSSAHNVLAELDGGVSFLTSKAGGAASSLNDEINLLVWDGIHQRQGAQHAAQWDRWSIQSGTAELIAAYGVDTLRDLMIGGAFDDELYGGGGNDYLLGGAGNDILDGGDGQDVLEGGLDDDTYIADDLDIIIEKPNGGIDTVIVQAGQYTLGENLENLVLTTAVGSERVTATGNSLNNTLSVGGASGVLNGLGGADTLLGGELNDVLDGGTGIDLMYGMGGNDSYIVDEAGDQTIELAGEGFDTVDIHGSALTNGSYTLQANIEKGVLLADAGAGSSLRGNSGDNTLTGNGLGNKLYGEGGADLLDGRIGSAYDELYGGAGVDALYGKGDLVVGGADDDNLWGSGSGSVFQWSQGDGLDTLWETHGGDTVEFKGVGSAYSVSASFSGNDMILSASSGGGVVVKDWKGVGNTVSIKLANGVEWSAAELQAAFKPAETGVNFPSGVASSANFVGIVRGQGYEFAAGDDYLSSIYGQSYLATLWNTGLSYGWDTGLQVNGKTVRGWGSSMTGFNDNYAQTDARAVMWSELQYHFWENDSGNYSFSIVSESAGIGGQVVFVGEYWDQLYEVPKQYRINETWTPTAYTKPAVTEVDLLLGPPAVSAALFYQEPVTTGELFDSEWGLPTTGFDFSAVPLDASYSRQWLTPDVWVNPQPFDTTTAPRFDALVTIAPVDTSMMLLPQLKAA